MEIKTLEPWVSIRHRLFKDKFEEAEFSKDEAVALLEQHGKGLSNINELLADLVKEGYLETRNDPQDARRTLYKLTDKEIHIGHLTRDKLISLLKSGANLIRLRVDYRVLLILLFYKSLSDNYSKKVKKYLDEGMEKEDAYHLVNIEYYTLYDEADGKLFTWEETAKDKVRIISNFVIALNKVSDLNEKIADLKHLVEKLGFNSLLSNEDNFHIFLDLVDLFNKIDFTAVDYDVLGAGYEWILSYFASLNVKEGELYTPKEAIRLMVNLLDVEEDSDVLDPAGGSCSMLLEAVNHVREKHGNDKSVRLEAQEISDVTSILGKLNMLLHNVYNYKVHAGDSLINPKFKEADYVLANPPWNQSGYDEKKLNTEDLKRIYDYGATSKQSADWAWVQLMLKHARKKVAVILDEGALFRAGKEETIREKILKEDLIESVILLPEKLFYNTMSQGIILMLNKQKSEAQKGKVFFINMTKEYVDHPEVRKLNKLSEENISKAFETFKNLKEIEHYSCLVDIETILTEFDKSLNVSLYVYPKDEKEDVVLSKEYKTYQEETNVEQELEKSVEEDIQKIIQLED